MNFSFNYYNKLEDCEFYLCNPDGRELYSICAYERNVALRFNDISAITFKVPATIQRYDGVVERAEYYDLIETTRLIYVTSIGWFKIASVSESDDGKVKYKSVETESLQSVFKNKGFVSEERVYCFYNPSDPYDTTYDSGSPESVPSVLGQLYRQLGIRQDLKQEIAEPETPYEEWTITYVSPSLKYHGDGSICRTFTDTTTYGYDWMVNDVEEAFKVVFVFDFMNKAIQIKTVGEATARKNLCLSFHNFLRNIQVIENADEIVTVLSCNGNGVDITQVNPTGTNYIVDFSYYMDEVNHRWMSDALISKLKRWMKEVESEKSEYASLISQLREKYLTLSELEAEHTELSVSYKDMTNAVDKYITSDMSSSELQGIVAAEKVEAGHKSHDSTSNYYDTSFNSDAMLTGYTSQPDYDSTSKEWCFYGSSAYDTATNLYNSGYYYFSDGSSAESYCMLNGTAKVTVDEDDPLNSTATYYCDSYTKYTGIHNAQKWATLKGRLVSKLNSNITDINAEIDSLTATINAIASRLNILNYFANTPSLLRELNAYWIEGSYSDENISATDDMSQAQRINLSNELLSAGETELKKICQPRYSFSVDSNDFLKNYDYKDFANELQLGGIITAEKGDGLWYYPALLEMSFSLDSKESISLTFANALRLDDWGYTYADLISEASSTSRQISANWSEIMEYSKNKDTISELIKNPLDMTLRAGMANTVNQEFTIDKTGILGRKFTHEGADEFEDEQMRILNNLILFTDDCWETAKTALGKIQYKDSSGNTKSAYGLIAQVLVGSMILGETLELRNDDSSIFLNNKGIKVMNGDGETVFEAGSDGTLTVKNYATSDSVSEISSSLKIMQSEITAKVSSSGGGESFSWKLDEDGFYLYANSGISPVFKVDSNGAVINGEIHAQSGWIGTEQENMIWEIGWCDDPDGILGEYGSVYLRSGVDKLQDIGFGVKSNNVYLGTNGLMYSTLNGDDTKYTNYNFTTIMRGGFCAYYGSETGDFNFNHTLINHTHKSIDFYGYSSTDGMGLSGITIGMETRFGYIGIEKNSSSTEYIFRIDSPQITSCKNIYPSGKGIYSLGSSDYYWNDIYADNSVIQTSDANKKHSVESLAGSYSLFFDKLRPVTYKLNNGSSDRTHSGFIAQEVEVALIEAGLTTKDFAGICVSSTAEENTNYGLRYSEFIALNTYEIQKLKTEIVALKEEINLLKS